MRIVLREAPRRNLLLLVTESILLLRVLRVVPLEQLELEVIALKLDLHRVQLHVNALEPSDPTAVELTAVELDTGAVETRGCDLSGVENSDFDLVVVGTLELDLADLDGTALDPAEAAVWLGT